MDRRGSRFTAEVLAQLLGIPGDITHMEFNHKTNTIDVTFTGNGSYQCAEGQEVCILTPQAWQDWDEERAAIKAEEIEEELIEQWESAQGE